MRHSTRLLIAIGLVWAFSLQAQAPAPGKAPLSFEVTSVKLSEAQGGGGGIRPMAGGQTYVATNIPVKLIMKLMYHLMDSQIIGGPEWLDTARYDIQGKAERPSNIDELHEMFKTLLADRFKLQFHRSTKELPMYALTVDKPGKLKVNQSPQDFEIPIKPVARGNVNGVRVPMDYLCWFLSQQMDRPVVNQTHLDGNYDFNLKWTPEPPPGAAADPGQPPADPDGVPLMTALRQQLGLKIQLQKGPVEVFVIDHAERPTEN